MSENAKSIGNLVGHTGVRDAIHVPIISACAKESLNPGCPVKVLGGGEAVSSRLWECLGVVDPFLTQPVAPGEAFWVWLRPGSIATLTHHWTHKSMPDIAEVVPEKEKARARLAEFAEGPLGVTLATMLERIESCLDGGGPLYDHGYEGLCVYDGFWDDYRLYTGKPDKPDNWFYFFTCGGCS